MPRLLLVLLFCLAPLRAQYQAPPYVPPPKQAPPKQGELKKERSDPSKQAQGKEEIPPEEDTSIGVTEYSFNPLQSEKDVGVGNYYFKLGKLRAAEGRFRTATKWNDGNAEAWLRLGNVEEKLKDPKAAKEAYGKYLEVASDAKNAADIRKKVEKLK